MTALAGWPGRAIKTIFLSWETGLGTTDNSKEWGGSKTLTNTVGVRKKKTGHEKMKRRGETTSKMDEGSAWTLS